MRPAACDRRIAEDCCGLLRIAACDRRIAEDSLLRRLATAWCRLPVRGSEAPRAAEECQAAPEAERRSGLSGARGLEQRTSQSMQVAVQGAASAGRKTGWHMVTGLQGYRVTGLQGYMVTWRVEIDANHRNQLVLEGEHNVEYAREASGAKLRHSAGEAWVGRREGGGS